MDGSGTTFARPVGDDFDGLEPWFFEAFGELDSTHSIADTPAPSEDIWKKFELLLTPPISPQHEPNYSTVPSFSADPDRLQLVSDSLDDLDSMDYPFFHDDELDMNLNSNLIQDCMWSSITVDGLSKNSSLSSKKDNTKLLEVKSSDISSSNSDLQCTTECVDPMSIFPYHPTRTTEADNLGNETPSDSEDEEIDVVTVNSEKTQLTKRKPVLPASSSMSAQVAAMHNYNAPAPSGPPSPAHSSSSGYSSASPSPPPTPVSHHNYHSSSNFHVKRTTFGGIKKLKITLPQNNSVLRSNSRHHRHHKHHKRRGNPTHSSRNNSSDSEDSEGRRSMHNILERKRRDDLKVSFMTLRDNIPDLDTQERAPKVVILKKAADYINKLNRQHTSYLTELERQRRRNEQLRQRLTQLKNM